MDLFNSLNNLKANDYTLRNDTLKLVRYLSKSRNSSRPGSPRNKNIRKKDRYIKNASRSPSQNFSDSSSKGGSISPDQSPFMQGTNSPRNMINATTISMNVDQKVKNYQMSRTMLANFTNLCSQQGSEFSFEGKGIKKKFGMTDKKKHSLLLYEPIKLPRLTNADKMFSLCNPEYSPSSNKQNAETGSFNQNDSFSNKEYVI